MSISERLTGLLVVLCLLGGAGSQPAVADYIILKNGQKLRGEIASRTEAGIVLRMPSLEVTVAQDQVRTVVKEPAKVYFEQEGRKFLERGAFGDVVKFCTRGKKQCPDHEVLGTLAQAGAKMLEARAAAAKLDFHTAAGLTREAQAHASDSNRLKVELTEIEATARFFKANGSLPGEFLTARKGRVRVLHHHPVKGKAWVAAVADVVDRLWKAQRRSRAHKLSSEALFEVKIYRNKAEYEAAAAKVKRPFGVLPDTTEARMFSRSLGATWMAVADKHIAALAARFVADQLYNLGPLWLIEGVAAGGLDKLGGERRAALAKSETRMTLEKLMGIRSFADLSDEASRKPFIEHAVALVAFLAGWPDGRRALYKALDKSRAVMSYELRQVIVGKKKMKKGISLKLDDLMPLYVRAVFPGEYRFKTLAALEASFQTWLETGARKR